MNRSLAASGSIVRRIIGVQFQPVTLSVRQIHILRPAFHPTASAEGFPSLPPLPHSAHSLLPPPSIAAAYTRVKYYGSGEHVRSSRIEDKVPVMSPGDKVKEAFREADASSDVVVSDYWGITPTQVLREDGTPWPWKSFRPWDAYKPDISIDLKRHHKPDNFIDKIAFWTVKMLRLPTDLFFQEKLKKRYGCRAMMLETFAAVPGMVAGMLLHCKSLRRFEHSGGWIRALLEEAENERMHLMTFMEVAKPHWYERALVFAVQGGFFNVYFLLYLFSPRLCHRMTGYLEEEAIYSYTEFLKEIDKGNIANVPAPAIAIDYWQLAKDAMLKDVVMVVRADEAHHRDVNHFAADIHEEGKLLKDIPAPLGYH